MEEGLYEMDMVRIDDRKTNSFPNFRWRPWRRWWGWWCGLLYPGAVYGGTREDQSQVIRMSEVTKSYDLNEEELKEEPVCSGALQ